MIPAHQRFKSGNGALDRGLRLVKQHELSASRGRAKVALEGAPLAQPPVHFRFEKADRAAFVGLGAIERGIGIGQQNRCVGAVGRIHGDADAHAGTHALAGDRDLTIEAMQETLCERRRRGRLRAVGADDCELVAAEPRDKSTFAGSLQADGDLPQQRASPTAWPNTSLTSLKRSRSMQITAKFSCAIAARSSAASRRMWKAARFGRSVSAS